MNHHTLVLTPWMSPHRIVPWQRAISDYFAGDIEILETYDETVSSPSVTMNVPCIARLKRPVASFKKGVKFSRINVLTRDDFTCCYCGRKLPMRELNYDHVIPRAMGGKTVWENIATSCYPCNTRKDSRTPAQAGMRLLKKPFKPKTLPMTSPAFSMRHLPDKWKDYLSPTMLAMAGG